MREARTAWVHFGQRFGELGGARLTGNCCPVVRRTGVKDGWRQLGYFSLS